MGSRYGKERIALNPLRRNSPAALGRACATLGALIGLALPRPGLSLPRSSAWSVSECRPSSRIEHRVVGEPRSMRRSPRCSTCSPPLPPPDSLRTLASTDGDGARWAARRRAEVRSTPSTSVRVGGRARRSAERLPLRSPPHGRGAVEDRDARRLARRFHRGLAASVRAARRAAVTERARTAPVKMLFPLVFLVLPAFLLLTVVPVLLTTVQSIAERR